MSSPDRGEPEVPGDAPGRRVSCGGHRGTVRYVGAVPPSTGLWLGVEWDDPERGKHNGSHEGVQYFTCRLPGGGSFVRPKKLSFGVDFLAAARARYELDVQEATQSLQLLGQKKMSLFQFPNVCLEGREVNGPGLQGDIRTSSPDVRSLNLSGNLLSCWEDVAGITQHMEGLRCLLLSSNRLHLPSDPLTLRHAFSNLTELSLNSCALTWPQLLQCAPMWPQLEELYVAKNHITELQRPVDVLQDLRVLDLSSNNLQQHSLTSLAQLPRLENLNLLNTGVSVLRFNDVPHGGKTEQFPALKVLVLDDNNISEWAVVNELEKLRSLAELSCRRNNLLSTDANPETVKQLFIAKLGQLSMLNRIQVSPEDRKGAELDYIKLFGEEWLKTGGHRDPEQSRPSAAFTSQHPRYQALIQKYGAPEDGELRKQQPFTLKNHLIGITFVCPGDTERKPIVKKLPGSMVVQKVKGLLHRLLKLPAAELTLSYTSSKMEGTEVQIDNDLKTLQFYSIEDGDSVLVRWS